MVSFKKFLCEDSTIAGGALGPSSVNSGTGADPYKITYADNDARWIFGKDQFKIQKRKLTKKKK